MAETRTTTNTPWYMHAITMLDHHGLLFGLGVIFAVGFGLGFGNDANSNIPQPYNRISSVIGWTYFACWSISFWPQVFLNWRRQSVVGLSLDFEVYNMFGYTCYTIYNSAFFGVVGCKKNTCKNMTAIIVPSKSMMYFSRSMQHW